MKITQEVRDFAAKQNQPAEAFLAAEEAEKGMTGAIKDDPSLADKRFPGNPTLSYHSREPLSVICEVVVWQGHSPERLQAMNDYLERVEKLGIEAID
jgi:hypothetical protein